MDLEWRISGMQLLSNKVFGWTDFVPVEDEALQQLKNISQLPFIYKHIAVMPDVHLGKGATVGSVIATKGAIIPAAVGVDIGCGMVAVQTNLTAEDLPDSLSTLRSDIEAAIPVGFAAHDDVLNQNLAARFVDLSKCLSDKYGNFFTESRIGLQLGTLGGGNHFIELCLDTEDKVWVMLHSGSRNFGNNIGNFFINKAKEEMQKWYIQLPDSDLAYIPEGSQYFDDYIYAVDLAQEYAKENRAAMLHLVFEVLQKHFNSRVEITMEAINCHHNYIARENHMGSNVYITRKGAVRAREGDLGIIPGSMGAKSFIVKGRGNAKSFCSCSHGAGRVMSRTQASKEISLEEHEKATAGVECRKDKGVIDESPRAYKNIDDVMRSQEDLVEVVATLKQVMCIKG